MNAIRSNDMVAKRINRGIECVPMTAGCDNPVYFFLNCGVIWKHLFSHRGLLLNHKSGSAPPGEAAIDGQLFRRSSTLRRKPSRSLKG